MDKLWVGVVWYGRAGMKQPGEETVALTSRSAPEEYNVWKERMEGKGMQFTQRMILLNVIGFLAHVGGILYVVIAPGDRITMKVSMTEWKVTLASDSLEATGNSTHIWSSERVHAYFVSVAACVIGIHLISSVFHGFIACTLVVSYWVPRTADWYLRGLYLCRAPWRWAEYSLSATLMIFITVVLMGVRDTTSVYAISSLCFVTQLFGWLTEVHSSGLIDRTKAVKSRKLFCGMCGPEYDLSYTWKEKTLRDRLGWHHLMGYIPFLTMWYLIMDSFYMYRNGLGDLYPDFMDYVVWGSIVFFTLFGVTQFLQQLDDYGPSWYAVGEASYVALSFLAKVWIGVIITWQMIAEGAQWDGTVGAEF